LATSPFEYLERALDARRDLTELDAYRVLHDRADGIPGLVLEKLGPALIVQCHEGRLELPPAQVRELAEIVRNRLDLRAVYRKVFLRDRSGATAEFDALHHDPQPWIGEQVEPELRIAESGLRFIVRPYDGYSTGLFLEQRDNRAWIRRIAASRRVLNTFAYTCAFSVAAAAGEAATVDSVDVSPRYLEWGRQNFVANGLDISPHRFFRSDVFDFYGRARRQGRSYDLIVLDPPSFGRSRRPRRVFAIEEQLGELVAGAVELLEPGGFVLLSVNHRPTSLDNMEQACVEAASQHGRRCTMVDRPALPSDFAGDPDYGKSIIARFD
jgi:23S rRNA (cytosine1962-C5)-methyltransferase